jgi:hypothetical protein
MTGNNGHALTGTMKHESHPLLAISRYRLALSNQQGKICNYLLEADN